MLDYNKTKQYDVVAIVVLFAIFSAIAVAIAQLLQPQINVQQVIVISLQKVISNSRAIIPCIIAFIGSVITAPDGYLEVIKELCDLDPYIAALNVNNEEQIEYQKCPEIIPFLLDRFILISIISYSLLIFVGINIATAVGKYYNMAMTDLNSKIKMVLLIIIFSAILNIIRIALAVTKMPKIVVKNYNKIKYKTKQQSEEMLSK